MVPERSSVAWVPCGAFKVEVEGAARRLAHGGEADLPPGIISKPSKGKLLSDQVGRRVGGGLEVENKGAGKAACVGRPKHLNLGEVVAGGDEGLPRALGRIDF